MSCPISYLSGHNLRPDRPQIPMRPAHCTVFCLKKAAGSKNRAGEYPALPGFQTKYFMNPTLSCIHVDNSSAIRLHLLHSLHMLSASFHTPGYSRPYRLQKQPALGRTVHMPPDLSRRLRLPNAPPRAPRHRVTIRPVIPPSVLPKYSPSTGRHAQNCSRRCCQKNSSTALAALPSRHRPAYNTPFLLCSCLYYL